ncbi:MAG TPA: type II toxin-antitoxin system VapC family toxin [Desulfuromonadales bacterium]|nr:type II toxin-antitoxin system VapC family toxin [Desulfuromonadales bacterium]
MTIFLDANIIIYRVEAVNPFYQHLLAIVKELVAQHPDARFAVSRLSMLECLVKPLREQNNNDIELYRAFFSSTGLQIIEINAQVIETATLLRARHGLRTPDAIQAASALSIKGPVTFLTGDKQLKKIPGLNVQLVATGGD